MIYFELFKSLIRPLYINDLINTYLMSLYTSEQICLDILFIQIRIFIRTLFMSALELLALTDYLYVSYIPSLKSELLMLD